MDNLIQETGCIIDFSIFYYQNYVSTLTRNGKTYTYQPFGFVGRSNNNEHPKLFLPKTGLLISEAVNKRSLNGISIWCCTVAKDIVTNVVSETQTYSTITSVQLHQDNIILNLGVTMNSNGKMTYVNQGL